ncbi:Protein transport protein SEC31 [Durusdinium trenchii]|uniref:Protein transport protein SEC31 n=1 Tax=Durusdinium trenchii TaxID=1381693 RepID=A0ABP0SMJ8_9DINO
MSILQEIEDKGATTAWCPVEKGLIALGTKDGASGETFDDYGGELSVYSLGYKSGAKPEFVGKAETTTRFNCMAWGSKGPSGLGIIAGGMQNGSINVWDPKKLESPLAKVEKHKSSVNSMQFNPHSGTEHLLATGASDNEVYIMDLNKPATPNVYSPAGPNCRKHTAEVRSVSWNTEVVHVLATAGLDATCTVWSLKAKKPWAEIRDPNGAGFSAISWSPAQGLHLLTASNDDRDPVLRLWDVRSSTTNPLCEYRGHTGGIFSVAWCPSDPTFVVSCAKDNRTLLWDLMNGKAVCEFGEASAAGSAIGQGGMQGVAGMNGANGMNGYGQQNGAAAAFGGGQQANNVFGGQGGGLGSGQAGRRYQIAFSPHDPTVFAACTFDRKVQLVSINGGVGGVSAALKAASSQPPYMMRAPMWTRRKCGGAFGFGGHFVHFGAPPAKPTGGPVALLPGHVQVSKVTDDDGLVAACAQWEQMISDALNLDAQLQHQGVPEGVSPFANLIELCTHKAAQAGTLFDGEAWGFMKVLFDPSARDKILQQLGFDMDELNRVVSALDKRAQAAAEQAAAEAAAAAAATPASPQATDPGSLGAPMMDGQLQQQGMQQQGMQQQGMQQQGMQQMQQGMQQMQFGGSDPSQVFGTMNDLSGAGAGDATSAFESFERNTEEEAEQTQQVPEEQSTETPSSPGLSSAGGTNPTSPTLQPAAAGGQTQEEQVPEEASSGSAPAEAEGVPRRAENVSLEDAELVDPAVNDKISKALLVGNFAVAVDHCLENNRFADALVLSSCGGGELWSETLKTYLERFYTKKPYIPVLAAVSQQDYETYVQQSNLSGDSWKEVLAIVSQFAKSEAVPGLCEVLAGRLEKERHDEQGVIAACICYICAKNVEKTAEIFIKQGLASTAQQGDTPATVLVSKEVVEKTTVYRIALGDSTSMMSFPNVMEHYITYAEALAAQGALEFAAKYVAAVDTSIAQPTLQTGYDQNGQPYEVAEVGDFAKAHNQEATRALILADRIFGAHPNPEYGLSEYLPARLQAFEVQQIGVAAPAQAAPAAPAPPRVMPPALVQPMQALEQHMQRLGQAMVSAMEKRKHADAMKSVAALREKLVTGLVGEDLLPEVSQLITCIVNGDLTTAGSIRQGLTSRPQVWAEQKDWLKGMTVLVMISKR